MKKQIFISIILTIICLFATNKLWLVFKPMPVSFNMFGNGTYKVKVVLNKKDNNEFKKVKEASKEIELSNEENEVKIKVKRAKFPKRLKLVISQDDTSKKLNTIYISGIKLNKEKFKFTSEKDFSVKNAVIKVADNKLYITPINNNDIEIIYNTPLTLRSSISFKFHIFLFFFLLPSLLVFYANKYKNEIFAYINKFLEYCKNNKKIVTISLLLAIIFTILTPHWWVKGEYWQNKIKYTTLGNLKIKILNSTQLDSGTYLTNNLKYLLNTKDFSYFVKVDNKSNSTFIIYTIKNFVPVGGKTFNANFFVNTDNDIEFILPNNIDVKSFKINNTEYIRKFNNDGKLVLKNLYRQNVSLKYSMDLKSKKISLASNISYFNLFLSFTIYFIIINFILSKKNKLNCIINFIKQYKIDIILFLMLFLFYMILNNFAIYHTNYACYASPTTVRIASVLWHTTIRYHVYWFLPFYPLFDFMLVFTKNITFILMAIYSLLTSFTVLFVYKILKNINPKMKYINFILTLIFGFSYTVIRSYYTFDTYPITAFYLSLIILLVVRELKIKTFSNITMFIILFIIVLSFGVTAPNFVTLFILTFFIFLIKIRPKTIAKYSMIFLCEIFLFFICMSNIANGNMFTTFNSSTNRDNISQWVLDKSQKVGFTEQTLRMPMLAQDKNYSKVIMNSFWICFASMILLSLILLVKSPIKKEDKVFYISLLLALLYNFVANYYWYQRGGFMFAPNHFALWFVIFAYCLKIIDEELKKHKMTINNNFVVAILVLFLLVEIPTNYIANKKVQNDAMKKYPLTSPIIEVVK